MDLRAWPTRGVATSGNGGGWSRVGLDGGGSVA